MQTIVIPPPLRNAFAPSGMGLRTTAHPDAPFPLNAALSASSCCLSINYVAAVTLLTTAIDRHATITTLTLTTPHRTAPHHTSPHLTSSHHHSMHLKSPLEDSSFPNFHDRLLARALAEDSRAQQPWATSLGRSSALSTVEYRDCYIRVPSSLGRASGSESLSLDLGDLGARGGSDRMGRRPTAYPNQS